MDKSVKRFYWSALFSLLILFTYPIAMGIRIVVLHLQNGSIQPKDYAQYVIPYAAVCLSILLAVLLYPFISKWKRSSVWIASLLGMGLFVGMELYIEGITIHTTEAQSTLQWQLASCIGSTEAMQAFQKLYDNTFKIHYFLISFLLILIIIGTIYSYGNVMGSKNKQKRNLLHIQIVCTILFVAFCITANATAFFREAVDYLSPLSSILTSSYFVVMGLTFGMYLAGFLAGRRKFVSIFLPALAALLITTAMYYGEYKMLNGVLYRFGYTKFFQPLPYTVVALADILVMMLPSLFTAFIVGLIRFLSRNSEQHDRLNKESEAIAD